MYPDPSDETEELLAQAVRVPPVLQRNRAFGRPSHVPFHHSSRLALSFHGHDAPLVGYPAMDMLAFVVVGEPQLSPPVTEDMLASLPTYVIDK